MGVPAFYRWLSEKYPRIVIDMIEQRPMKVDGRAIPLDLTEPNPNDMEFDNLYIDMNGIIHPCSHPEDRPAPESEEEMFHNVMLYVDRIFAAVRPRKVLFLAIDGVAPRAKLNQQRTRRFRSAQEAREKEASKRSTREEMIALGRPVPPEDFDKEWDSNVITPGTEFMTKLSNYIRFYIQDRINTDPLWKTITVLFSDGSDPGEGEHKIMDFIRKQRAQPGYDPNVRHILHGLDADLIMLGLATHEAHFTVLREQVFFGRRNNGPTKSQAQQIYESMNGITPDDSNEFPFTKPFQMLHIPTLREYLQNEFSCLQHALPFPYDFERIIDDFVFMCFFVGNDFLPHLPSLDIRDGAIDFLYNVYKRVLPSLGNYLTSPGGKVNLDKVDVILAEVGKVEDEVFRRRRQGDERENARVARRVKSIEKSYGMGSVQDAADSMLKNDATIALGRSADSNRSNQEAAKALKAQLKAGQAIKRRTIQEQEARKVVKVTEEISVEVEAGSLKWDADGNFLGDGEEDGGAGANGEEAEVVADVVDEEEEELIPKPKPIPPALQGTELANAQKELESRLNDKKQAMLNKLKEEIFDTIRLYEDGWKDRYYRDKLKKQNVESGGGKKTMFQKYVEGLCWVYLYYYEGCPSWGWYYPFHYAPFASDLVNIDRYTITFEQGEPLKPLEQLMAVLPPDSAEALPMPYAQLMTDPDSPIKDFYPTDVAVDPNGKAMPWLWVVLLPFIDIKELISTVREKEHFLSAEEKKRNSFGETYIYIHQNHYLAPDVLSMKMEETMGENGNSNTLVLDAREKKGFSGTLLAAPADVALTIGTTIRAPRYPEHTFFDIEDNNAVTCVFRLPQEGSHLSKLLQGAALSPPRLTQRDLMPRGPPRLGRGGVNIADLGQQLGYAPHQNMINHSLGGNFHYQQSPQDIDRTGMRSWGTMTSRHNKTYTAQQQAFYPQQPQGPPRQLLPPGMYGHGGMQPRHPANVPPPPMYGQVHVQSGGYTQHSMNVSQFSWQSQHQPRPPLVPQPIGTPLSAPLFPPGMRSSQQPMMRGPINPNISAQHVSSLEAIKSQLAATLKQRNNLQQGGGGLARPAPSQPSYGYGQSQQQMRGAPYYQPPPPPGRGPIQPQAHQQNPPRHSFQAPQDPRRK